MSNSDGTTRDADDLAFQLARHCEVAIETGDLDRLSEVALASALTAMLRLLAARAQSGISVNLAAGNNRLAATDAVIGSTAILESASIEVFELAAWQAMTTMGSSKRSDEINREPRT